MILLICISILMGLHPTELKPLVVVTQSTLRWNATNDILITTTNNSANKLVDVSMEIYASSDPSILIFRQILQTKIAGSLNRVKFFVPDGIKQSDSYRLVVRAENDSEPFEEIIPGAPDLRNIYLQTDKTVYKPTDIVKVRSLPLTTSGKLYNGPVDFALVNPNGFELIHKTESLSDNRFLAVEFQLPDHLAFGEWKILARPNREKVTHMYSVTFQVREYELPQFLVYVLARETDDPDLYEIDVVARHTNGRQISGKISLWCNCDVHSGKAMIPSDSGESFLCMLKSSKKLFNRSVLSSLNEGKKIIAAFDVQMSKRSSGSNTDIKNCNSFRGKPFHFATNSSETNDSRTLTVLPASTMGSSMVDVLVSLDESVTDGSARELFLTLGHTQEICDMSTTVESSLSSATMELDRSFFDHSCSSLLSVVFASTHDDEDDGNNDRNYASNESAPSTSGNYLDEWTPQYSSSLSIFATLSSGNFLSENEITEVFSRYGNIKEVKWIQISDNNGYLIVFSNETEKDNAIKVRVDRGKKNNEIGCLDCISTSSMTDQDENEPCVSDDAQLPEFTDSLRSMNQSSALSKTTLSENMPSPERPGTRPSPATALLLKQISDANTPETGQFYERTSSHESGSQKNRFLNLPAPYHLLPDTPYFRRAPIVPPPTRSLSVTEQMPVQQRIINRYLASMKMDDENGFAAIARYERECYERLLCAAASSYCPLTVLPEQQRYGCFETEVFQKDIGNAEFDTGSEVTVSGGGEKQVLSTECNGHRTVEEQTKICNNLQTITTNDWSTPSTQHYEIWNCAPL